MCRLLAVSAESDVSSDYYITRAPVPFRSFGDKRNADGWGVGWFESGQPVLFKDISAGDRSKLLPLIAENAVSRIVLTHLRKASQGELRRCNCHPFVHEGWIFAHNGTIHNAFKLKSTLRGRYRTLTSGTDSEIYFHLLLQAIDRCKGDAVAGIRDVTSKLNDFTSLNFILSDGCRLFAYRNSSERVRHFSLFYRQVRRPLLKRGRKDDPRRFPHVVVCSNKLTPGRWRAIPLGHLLTVEPELTTQMIKLH